MNDLRTAAQQALEAMLNFPDDISNTMFESIAALKAALAQQAGPVLVEGELPPRYVARSPVQAEPVEPVAWRFEARHIDTAFGPAVSLKHPGPEHKYMRNVEPLYTAPPRRTMVPLTEEEIVDAVRETDLDWQAGWTLDEHAPNRFATLVRAIEKAVWEKNNGQA